MRLEITSKDGTGMLAAFAQEVETTVERGCVTVPEKFGSGYMRGLMFAENFRMLIRDYALNEDFSITRNLQSQPSNMLLFTFSHVIRSKSAGRSAGIYPSVQITTQGLNGQQFEPAHTRQNSISIAIDADDLRQMTGAHTDSAIVHNILENKQQLVFEEFVFEPLQMVVDQIVNARIPDTFHDFYFKLKAQELLCQLLIALVGRDEKTFYKLNTADVKTLYDVKRMLLENLDEPPGIEKLAAFSGMSESKLKRLFKQVFGKSIFHYFQSFRMQEAARLLKEEQLSVSEAGYRLGFTNLSHFARAFEEHIGMKPKRYAKGEVFVQKPPQ
ncbi:AraC family transcriptional regulator [Dyadobacter beijingensis]|uniref:AraC family transcriptional regulator n=1 Tax=Dyadobacter beijingensis TaxID=365489 RepID=A0ABQ2HPR7_9BACT|nr:AraC family transcriptional regulator [Dyadobacter beijingensis]GGM85999.1 AraC family transcriptional regulator [Dyadobacter beijingensis]